MSASRREGFETDAFSSRQLAVIRRRHLDCKGDGYVQTFKAMRYSRSVAELLTIKERSHFEEVITQCDVM